MRDFQRSERTGLGWWKSGSGPRLLCVHGDSLDHTCFAPVAEHLEDFATICAIDRPGYGANAEVRHGSVEQAGQLVADFVAELGGVTVLFGFSGGAHVALHASINLDRLGGVILFEPPDTDSIPSALGNDMRRLLDEECDDEAIERFFLEAVRMTPTDIAGLRQSPVWPAIVERAAALTTDAEYYESYSLDLDLFHTLAAPVTLFAGSESPEHLAGPSHALANVIPDARLVALQGHSHSGLFTASELIAKEVKRDLAGRFARTDPPRPQPFAGVAAGRRAELHLTSSTCRCPPGALRSLGQRARPSRLEVLPPSFARRFHELTH